MKSSGRHEVDEAMGGSVDAGGRGAAMLRSEGRGETGLGLQAALDLKAEGSKWEGGTEGGREGGRDGRTDGGRQAGREGGTDGGREDGKRGWRHGIRQGRGRE